MNNLFVCQPSPLPVLSQYTTEGQRWRLWDFNYSVSLSIQQ